MTRSKTATDRPAVSHQQLLELLDEHSDLSIAELARQQGIAPWRLYQANRSRRKARTEDFVEVTLAPERPAPFLELLLPGECTVRVPPGFDPTTLARLLEVLRAC